MSIYVICGDPGAGKSAFCVPLAEKFDKGDPRPIYSTFWMDIPNLHVVTWPEMCRLSGAVCFVDEAADPFNARDYAAKENKNQMGLFREHRKDGLTLFLVAQGYDMLDTNIRQMTRYVWHIKRLFGPNLFENETAFEQRFGVWSRAKCYHAKTFTKEAEGQKKRVCLSTQHFRVDKLYDRFDTLAKSAGLHGDKNTRGSGLAAGSVLAAEQRQGRARRQPRRLPAFVYPLVGVPEPAPRPVAVAMPYTKEEYFAWSTPVGGVAASGVTRWHGPSDLASYDRLPQELQVHPVGGPMPVASGLDLNGEF